MAIKILGQSFFGDAGFTQLHTGAEESSLKLTAMFQEIGTEKLITTNMTTKDQLDELKYDYIPAVVRYNPKMDIIFDAPKVMRRLANGDNNSYPIVDFVAWDANKYKGGVMTFSRTAPVLLFEAANGKKCLGVVLRKALMLHGSYLFDKILCELGASATNKVAVKVVTVTGRKYEDMGNRDISEYIAELASQYMCISEFEGICIVEDNAETCGYVQRNCGNHVVVVC